MTMTERRVESAEKRLAKMPAWLDFLPNPEEPLSMTYISALTKPIEPSTAKVRLAKAYSVEGKRKKRQITKSIQQIMDAEKWISNAYVQFIDQPDDQGPSFRVPDLSHVVTKIDSIRARFNRVYQFSMMNYNQDLELARQSQL